MFPMLMPLVMGGAVYFLYKKGVFGGMCHSKQHMITDNTHMDQVKNDSTPLEILKKRYAQGEISTEEYHKMKEELKE
ncbi:MAG: SHOCT domain-containing protein [Halanaerobacter sp.]